MSMTLALPEIRRLRLSPTLSAYIAKQYGLRLLSFFVGLCGIILLVTLVDILEQVGNRPEVGFGLVIQLALLKMPFLSQEVMPFTILFAGLATFWRLTRYNELVVARGAGISAWQFLLPVVAVAFLVGVVSVTMLNPLASALLGRYEALVARHVSHDGSVLAVSRTGLWLRQADQQGQSVIHAQRVDQDRMRLHEVIIFRYAAEDKFLERIDAETASLTQGAWELTSAWRSKPGKPPVFHEELAVPTELTLDKIQDSFAPPETVGFWALPGFIDILERAGFSGHRHQLQFHKLLALPFLFVAMILIAATFSLRPQRRGRVGLIIVAGVGAGFLLYFLSSFVYALGLSTRLPVILAGWSPAGVSLMLGAAMLLHLEDG